MTSWVMHKTFFIYRLSTTVILRVDKKILINRTG